MEKRGPKPKGKVNTVWRTELAYVLGLITADGSLSKNGRHIDFTSKDIDQLETYKCCLGIEDIKIGSKRSTHADHVLYYRVQFGDVLFYRWLIDRGLSPNKSKIIQKVDVPDTYFFDFVRGEWDGDGTIYCSKDKRWKNSHVVSIAFASGSLDFLQWLQKEINNRIGTTGHVQESIRAYQLRYARKDSRKLFDAMFYKADVPHLRRKFAKAEKIFKMNGL